MLRTTVIAITGSVGKSTAKECLGAILSDEAPTLKTLHNRNCAVGVPQTLLGLRPWHRYAVIEIGVGGPGQMSRSARLVKPHVAVVLSVARTHTNAFATLDDTAAEKAVLLDYLVPGGTAILNGDDPRVRRMAAKVRYNVVTCGRTTDCDLVAEGVHAAWPDRMRFTAVGSGGTVPVQTQLVGSHWVPGALASLAAARACGIELTVAAERLTKVPPFVARMQPVALPCGAVVIRDEETSSPDTVDAMFEVMREARAERRILVFGDLTDSNRSPRKRLRDVGKIAAQYADVVVFVGEHAHHGVRGAVGGGMSPERCHDVLGLERAAEWMAKELRAGDLLFLKGRGSSHLSRIVFAQFGSIGCWTSSCGKRPICDSCAELRPGFDFGRVLAAASRAT